MNEYIIETFSLTKKFQNQIGVNNLDLKVPKGKIYGLLGRNGAGKTTTMEMLLNLVQPNSGKILLFGEDYRKNPTEIYHKIGSIIETPGFYNNLTAYENLSILSKLRGQIKNKDNENNKGNKSNKDNKNNKGDNGNKSNKNNKDNENNKNNCIINSLKLVGLDKEKNKIFKNYSMGMKQRLGIAAAIMHDPELLILDEPINGLDPIGINEMRKFLLKLCKEMGTTILISSHVLSEIEQIADIIGVMDKGSLIDEIDMKELPTNNRQFVEFTVSDVNTAITLLKEEFNISDYDIYDNNTLRLYDSIEKRGKINQCFVKANLSVTKIDVNSEKLEEYFSGLIGGGEIA